jgi:hypothetical protein
MTKNLTGILTDGFELWKKNLIMGVPPLLSMLVQFVLWFVVVIIMLFALLGGGIGAGLFSGDIENIDALIASLGAAITVILLVLLFAIIITMLIGAFFTAGLIGMAKEAIETGKTEFSTMIEVGKRKFISLFFANLIVAAILLLPLIILGIIFLILMAMGYGSGIDSSNADAVILSSFLLIFLIFMLWVVYAMILGIILAVVNYAVVISDTGAVEGVKAGFRFFMNHKPDVFSMWLMILCISLVFGIVYSAIYMVFNFIPLIGGIFAFVWQMIFYAFIAVVITPLTALWWSFLYMDRKRETNNLTFNSNL